MSGVGLRLGEGQNGNVIGNRMRISIIPPRCIFRCCGEQYNGKCYIECVGFGVDVIRVQIKNTKGDRSAYLDENFIFANIYLFRVGWKSFHKKDGLDFETYF